MLLSYALALIEATAPPTPKDINAVLRAPDKVESFTVDSFERPDTITILPKGEPVTLAVASELAKVFLDPESFDDYIKGCGFQPGVAFRFTKGDKAIDVLICFRCKELEIRPAGSTSWRVGKKSFDRSAKRILALVRTARPNDPALKNLKWDVP